ncbi:hypothetical protein ARMGADRAFT_787188 [Armillaria gallica]|uniref:Uncharacterized protein n=1 Tax=Armillaria gallica TaxID=47427 RepID=A0A2H3DUI2_ARMGA|nr:hypothetical protein ARMGADRAFT_787188 [Armillaria gallica]
MGHARARVSGVKTDRNISCSHESRRTNLFGCIVLCWFDFYVLYTCYSLICNIGHLNDVSLLLSDLKMLIRSQTIAPRHTRQR